jgi:hypothetical protein
MHGLIQVGILVGSRSPLHTWKHCNAIHEAISDLGRSIIERPASNLCAVVDRKWLTQSAALGHNSQEGSGFINFSRRFSTFLPFARLVDCARDAVFLHYYLFRSERFSFCASLHRKCSRKVVYFILSTLVETRRSLLKTSATCNR